MVSCAVVLLVPVRLNATDFEISSPNSYVPITTRLIPSTKVTVQNYYVPGEPCLEKLTFLCLHWNFHSPKNPEMLYHGLIYFVTLVFVQTDGLHFFVPCLTQKLYTFVEIFIILRVVDFIPSIGNLIDQNCLKCL